MTDVKCPSCKFTDILYREECIAFHQAEYDPKYGISLYELVDSIPTGGAYFICENCEAEYTWEEVEKYMEKENE